MQVKDLQDSKYQLVSDSQDIEHILNSIGQTNEIECYGCLIVETLDGEYGEVWGIESNIPRLKAIAYKIQ